MRSTKVIGPSSNVQGSGGYPIIPSLSILVIKGLPESTLPSKIDKHDDPANVILSLLKKGISWEKEQGMTKKVTADLS